MVREKKKERLLAEAQQLWKHQKLNAIGAAEMIERIEMLDKVALDSNILAAMFFKENASQRALDAVTKPDLITLDLAVIEVGNVTWKQVTLFGKDRDQTLNALHKCQTLISEACDVVRAQDMMAKAYDISIVTTASFYDSLFLALAEKEQVPLLT